MDIDSFKEISAKIKNLPLPGELAHRKQEPPIRKKFREHFKIDHAKAKKSAVLVLVYPKADKVAHFLLIQRRSYNGVHSNQVGFPGGKVEPSDPNLLHTALRETEEEVGLAINRPKLVMPLSPLYIPPSNFLVSPFLAFIDEPFHFVEDEREVEELIEVKLKDLIDDQNLMNTNLSTSYANNISVPAFKLNGYTVWGATAMMLQELKDLLKPYF